jgi:DNA-binding transcriptional regulator YiaG
MILPMDIYGGSGGVSEMPAIIDRDPERVQRVDDPWRQALMLSMPVGSAGVDVVVNGYALYVPHFGTSPTVFDNRWVVPGSYAPTPEGPPERTPTTARHAMLRMSSADQALEVMAALNLNKSQFAEALRVTRPTLYEWLDGKEPNAANAQRLTALVRMLSNAGVTAADSISPRFVREPLNDGGPSLLDLLKAETLDESSIAWVLSDAKALENEAEQTRLARDERLRALGFEEPTPEQRKANLALNVALREWPKD